MARESKVHGQKANRAKYLFYKSVIETMKLLITSV